ncbi:matrixin family metalloprotease [Pseudorhodoplanes sp.]|uniref:matrixin family metalloprotease n=1 Tax=Pseudorhodoplanes sp. TaxID=1934341 RepID=UPI002C1E1FFD|nr:matrixin family metalloprotease [Pseudorhodoplanes sp.]HWV51660.1 matrixin family metalloprotease [Pseudorhodoplanes sp.]
MANRWLIRIFCALVAGISVPASGDTLVLQGGSSLSGRLLAFDRQQVVFADGCLGDALSHSWTAIISAEIGGACDGPPERSSQPINHRCSAEGFQVFAVVFKHSALPVLAENAAMTRNRMLHLDLLDPWDQAHGDVEDVRQITRVTVCRDDLKRDIALPLSYCSEPRQVAVAFDYKTPLSNRILTNGFSFYVRVSGSKPDYFDLDAFRKEVKSAFQNGISLWTSALHERQNMLTEPIQRFLESRISRSTSGYTMLLPPQVIELACPQAATFVVDLSFGNRGLFPRPPLVLAKAQTEGRTIALNVFDIKCFRAEFRFDANKRLRFELPEGCLNLVPIMTHELGHAFGIHHINDPAAHALMDERFSRDALVPTDGDVAQLIAVLSRSIEGDLPGAITMVSSNGVQPPADYVECPPQAAPSSQPECN